MAILLRTFAAACAALSAGAVCAGSVDLPTQLGGAYSVPTRSLKEARYHATIRQQYDFSCGSAAVATLLTHHYGRPTSEADVFAAMFQRGDQDRIRREGFSLLDMKRYLEAQGFQADGFEVPLEKLEEAGIPAIALINENGYNHFVVIKGIRDGRVLFGDPAGGTRALPIAMFQARWVNQIIFVITHPQQGAGFNLASDWRVAPPAPLREGIARRGLGDVVIPRLGPSDF